MLQGEEFQSRPIVISSGKWKENMNSASNVKSIPGLAKISNNEKEGRNWDLKPSCSELEQIEKQKTLAEYAWIDRLTRLMVSC